MNQTHILVCGFGPFPAAPRNPAAAVIEDLAASRWSPAGVEVDYLTLPVSWADSVAAIQARLTERPADGVLVVGVATTADAFRVETLGRNRASRSLPDQDEALWTSQQILADGPGVIASTAPTDEILAALIAANLPARHSEDAGDYLCNFTLYSLLAAQAAPQVGFLHVPQVREYAEAAPVFLADVERAVRAAVGAFAEALSPPVASRRTA